MTNVCVCAFRGEAVVRRTGGHRCTAATAGCEFFVLDGRGGVLREFVCFCCLNVDDPSFCV